MKKGLCFGAHARQCGRLEGSVKAIATFAILCATGSAVAQSDIDPVNKYAWQENCGWMNWRDANGAVQGVRDRGTYLAGFIWCENLGWINVGSGSPAAGVR